MPRRTLVKALTLPLPLYELLDRAGVPRIAVA